MTRHTREEVDKALDLGEHIRRSAALDYDKGDWRLDAAEDRAKRADVLAAEVRALREEVSEWKGEASKVVKLTALLLGVDAKKTCDALQEWETELPKLRATVARVEALPDLWRNMLELGELVKTGRAGAAVGEVVRSCAQDLEAALKGGA